MSVSMRYFKWAFAMTAVGLALAFWLGWNFFGTFSGGLSFLVICGVLAVLEVSLSFDNAIVNANKLKDMDPVWQRRFLTWGIVIAVFGMRVLFPLLVVVIAARIGPIAAIHLAAVDPHEYGRIMDEASLSISAFGGTFLMMVALNYFFDEGKEVDWIRTLECQMRRCASIRGLEIAMVLGIVLAFSSAMPPPDALDFIVAAIGGLLAFTAIETISHALDSSRNAGMALKGGLGAFLYLEVLDASFSFDGMIGAFALTQNLFLIAIGLGIGAMFVRSMTIMLVEKQTLSEFRYLEHGAFYSILALSIIMFAQSLVHIPEMLTGLIGAGLIAVALWSSIRYKRRVERA